jgi:hypothetical protein
MGVDCRRFVRREGRSILIQQQFVLAVGLEVLPEGQQFHLAVKVQALIVELLELHASTGFPTLIITQLRLPFIFLIDFESM